MSSEKENVYFVAGNVREYYDLFNGQHGFLFSLFDAARDNKNLEQILWQAVKNGFILDPSEDGLKGDVVIKEKDYFLTPLIYANRTIYRRVFRDKKEIVQLAKKIDLARKVLMQAIKEAIPHELGHYLWKNILNDEQKKAWTNLILEGDADIDYELLQKGYPDDHENGYKNLNEESFCSHINAYVYPDAKNLSGAKLVPRIEQFLEQTLQLS